jgi:hypothetical protein
LKRITAYKGCFYFESVYSQKRSQSAQPGMKSREYECFLIGFIIFVQNSPIFPFQPIEIALEEAFPYKNQNLRHPS